MIYMAKDKIKKRPIFASGSDSISDQFRFQSIDNYNLLFRLSTPSSGDLWKLEYFARSANDPSLMLPLEDYSFENGYDIFLAVAQKLAAASAISRFVNSSKPYKHIELTANEAYEFIKNHAFALRQAGFDVQIPKTLENNVKAPINLTLSMKNNFIVGKTEGHGMLKFDYTISIEGEKMNQEEFTSLTASKAHLVKVKNKWVEINPEDASKALELIKAALELEEDQVWNRLAIKRDTKKAKFVSHEKVWG